jgi:CRP-like cAMP-binding protein
MVDQRNGSNAPTRLNELIEKHCSTKWKKMLRDRNETCSYRKGDPIFIAGEKAERMYMIAHGRVKVVARISQGPDRIIRLVADGEALGHRAIGHAPTYTASGIALTETTVNSIPMELFLKALHANASFCYQFLLYFAEEMRRLDRHMRDMTTMDVTQRVAKVLMLNMESFGFESKVRTKLAFTLSRRDIANAAGTTYESVIRTLAELQRRRIIFMEGKEIHIQNQSRLTKLLVG